MTVRSRSDRPARIDAVSAEAAVGSACLIREGSVQIFAFNALLARGPRLRAARVQSLLAQILSHLLRWQVSGARLEQIVRLRNILESVV